MTTLSRKYALVWNTRCGSTYQELLQHESAEDCSASSVIEIAEGSTAGEVMSAIYNETDCDLEYIEYTVNGTQSHAHAVFQSMVNSLCTKFMKALDSDDESGGYKMAQLFILAICDGYLTIALEEHADETIPTYMELLHHLELTLQNKVDNT